MKKFLGYSVEYTLFDYESLTYSHEKDFFFTLKNAKKIAKGFSKCGDVLDIVVVSESTGEILLSIDKNGETEWETED